MGFYGAGVSNTTRFQAVSPLDSAQGGDQQESAAAEDITIADEDISEEAIVPRIAADVRSPTEKEVKDHSVNHLPFRNWCRHCICGKALERASSSGGHEKGCIPCVHADYIFMGEKDTSGTTPILVVKDDDTLSVFPDVVPEKGPNEFALTQIVEDIDMMGHTEI